VSILSIIIILTLLLISIYFAYKAYTFSIIILNIEKEIEESLDILNERYISIAKILEKEIFFDSIEVRQTIADIQQCHEAILEIANKLTINFKEEIDEIEKKDD